MKYITGFFAFWYDFIVGDAWEVAAGVLAALLLLYLGVRLAGANSWVSNYGAFFLPVAIVVLLGYSLWRVRDS